MKKNHLLITAFLFAVLLVLPSFFTAAQASDCGTCKIACKADSAARVEVVSSRPAHGSSRCGKKLDLSCSFSFKGKSKKSCCTTDGSCRGKGLRAKDGCGKGIKCLKKECDCKGKCGVKSCKGYCKKNEKCGSLSCGIKKHRRHKHKKHRMHKFACKSKKSCCTTDGSCKEKCLKPKDGSGKGIKFLQKGCDSKVNACRGYCKKDGICNEKSCGDKHHKRVRKYRNRKQGHHKHKGHGKCSYVSNSKPKASFLGKVSYITTNQLKSLVFSKTGFVLIDARSPKYDNGERIPGAVNFHTKTPASVISQAVPDKLSLIVVYCSSLKCPASHKMYKRLKKMGYLAVHEYRFGIEHWKKMKLPVTKSK